MGRLGHREGLNRKRRHPTVCQPLLDRMPDSERGRLDFELYRNSWPVPLECRAPLEATMAESGLSKHRVVLASPLDGWTFAASLGGVEDGCAKWHILALGPEWGEHPLSDPMAQACLRRAIERRLACDLRPDEDPWKLARRNRADYVVSYVQAASIWGLAHVFGREAAVEVARWLPAGWRSSVKALLPRPGCRPVGAWASAVGVAR